MVTDVAGFAAADVAPRRARRARGHDAARDGRRGDRRQDRRQPAGGQEPRRRVLAAGRRDLRPRRPRHAAGAGAALRRRRDGQVPLPHRRRPRRHGPRPTGSPAAWRSRPTSSPPTSARAGGGPLLNYGHTLAHALEIATGHELTHGEAVGDRARLRRRAGPHASGASTPTGSPSTGRRRRHVRPADDRARRARPPTSWWR